MVCPYCGSMDGSANHIRQCHTDAWSGKVEVTPTMSNGIKFEPYGEGAVRRTDGSVFKGVRMKDDYNIGPAETLGDWRERTHNQEAAERRAQGRWEPGDPIDLTPRMGVENTDDVEFGSRGGFGGYGGGGRGQPTSPRTLIGTGIFFLIIGGVIAAWSYFNPVYDLSNYDPITNTFPLVPNYPGIAFSGLALLGGLLVVLAGLRRRTRKKEVTLNSLGR